MFIILIIIITNQSSSSQRLCNPIVGVGPVLSTSTALHHRGRCYVYYFGYMHACYLNQRPCNDVRTWLGKKRERKKKSLTSIGLRGWECGMDSLPGSGWIDRCEGVFNPFAANAFCYSVCWQTVYKNWEITPVIVFCLYLQNCWR